MPRKIVQRKQKTFSFIPFSKKQQQVLTWWMEGSKHKDKDGIIADGSIRAGKSLIMSVSFCVWAMATFNYQQFGMAGKTIASFRRNVVFFLKIIMKLRGFKVQDKRSENYLIISKGGIENYFFIFGGKDESSQDLVQGLTAAGFYFDEVALMPESFVNQATGRCSIEGSKFWFNCNPKGPYHWFYINWVEKIKEKNLLRLHFTMEDNPSLSQNIIDRYKRMYTGVFYQRYILGLWVTAEGIIYSMFQTYMIKKQLPPTVKIRQKWIGIDYGQANATTFILCGIGSDNRLWILDEYYHAGRDSQVQKSPSTYAKDFRKWLLKNGGGHNLLKYEKAFIDPSAKGFMLQLHEEGVSGLRKANNEVNAGIELLSSIIECDGFRVIGKNCPNVIKELHSYSWDPKAQERGEDKPLKEHDHCLDGIRYVVNGTRRLWQSLGYIKSGKAMDDINEAA